MKKKLWFKSWVENFITRVELTIVAFFAMTIDNLLENTLYDIIAFILMGVFLGNMFLLMKFGKEFNQE